MNRVILCGNVGKAPEIRATNGGEKVANFSLATSERWKDRSGEKKESTTWHRVVVWGPLAGVVESYVTGGSKLLVEGSITSRKYMKDNEEKVAIEIKATNIELLDSKRGDSPATTSASPPPAKKAADLDDSIPF